MKATSQETIRPHTKVGSELVRLWFTEHEPQRGHVILVHGIAEHSGRYEHVGRRLADVGYHTTAFDLIGHGATGGRRGHVDNWADYLDQVENHVVATRDERVPLILLGHSMGGLIAAEYALSERPQPDLLVLSAPAFQGGANWQVKMAPLLSMMTPHLGVPSRIKGEQLSRDPQVGMAYFNDPLVNTRTTSRLGAELFASMARVRPRLGDIQIPTLVIHGGEDTIASVTASATVSGDRLLYDRLRHELFNEPEGPQVLSEVIGWIDARIVDLVGEGNDAANTHAQQ